MKENYIFDGIGMFVGALFSGLFYGAIAYLVSYIVFMPAGFGRWLGIIIRAAQQVINAN